MPDILTHALAAYVLATLLSFRYEWLTQPYVTVCTMGALIPDLVKIKIVLSSSQVEAWLGVPFSWDAIHTLGGSTVAALVGVVLVPPAYRRRVFALLLLGVLSHHALDALIVHPAGYGYDLFWPLSETWVPVGGLFHSSDRWPAAVALTAAAVIYVARGRWERTPDTERQRADSRS